ncbi:hypothetical protein [Cuspidothrix issatschenkoi]|uniref:Phage portal protein n=1 Tax=Cuspidothrix issatschenkoi CHARLIE-1 TaxID=2052836 RepID=A0A2S6CRP4_9CYAN|nr:hypothetical protein [Cuspidothrix issatschenkoi]PPJ62362.1 hypothetical protein CUN59_16100 [Cuspidothrix issatschenkoi CHARLIE-1]
MATKQELLDAYKGINPANTRELPVKIIQLIVEQIKSFLLGDSYQKKIKLLAINPEQQANLNLQLEQIKLYSLLQDVYLDVPVYGETYIEVSEGKLRHIRTIDVDDIKVDPLDPLKVVYLKESREIYDAVNNKYVKVKVEHYLTLSVENQTTLDLFNLPDYKYFVKVGDAEPVEMGDHIPIVRLVNSLDGRTAQSAIERLIHLQLEYNEVRSRINLNGKHHKPQVFTIGTSAPAIIGRTNSSQLESVESATGSAAFQTAFTSDAASILHLPISNAAAELGITPKIGYLQPVDSPYLERQRLIILQDIYSLTGVMLLELQNARSASSSSSLSVLYEPLQRATLSRANYLISAIKTIFLELGIDIPFRVELPDMMPRDLQDKKLQIEAVRHKLISRKRYLVEVEGLTEEEALKELEQLDAEKGLNIQYSAALTDSKDQPNIDEKTLFEESVIN